MMSTPPGEDLKNSMILSTTWNSRFSGLTLFSVDTTVESHTPLSILLGESLSTLTLLPMDSCSSPATHMGEFTRRNLPSWRISSANFSILFLRCFSRAFLMLLPPRMPRKREWGTNMSESEARTLAISASPHSSRNLSTRALFPIPAGPSIITTEGIPSLEASQESRRTDSSLSLFTNFTVQ